MRVRLYSIPGSNSAATARLLLVHKGLKYETVELPPAFSAAIMRALRFERTTVPGLGIDGRRIQNTRVVARVLDDLYPDPPLFPADPERRRAVEEAEQWGEEVLQPVARRLVLYGLKRNPTALASFLEGVAAKRYMRLGAALGVSRWALSRLAAVRHGVGDESAEKDLRSLPASLDRVDRWIESGLLGGANLTAADYQIAASVRMLLVLDDLRPLLALRARDGVGSRTLGAERGGHFWPPRSFSP